MIHTEQVVFRIMYVYTYTHMHTITISEKGGCEFEREQGEVYGRTWREEMEGENVFIPKSKNKFKKKREG